MKAQDKKIIQTIFEETAYFYNENLPASKRKYYLNLGLTKETIDEYQIGWANGKLGKYLRSEKLPHELCQKVGLIKKDGTDYFKNGLIIPYWSGDKVLGFRCRHSAESNDHKDYSINNGIALRIFNEEFIPEAKEVIVCQNELDCLLLQQLKFGAIAIPKYSSFNEQWIDSFKHCNTIYILLGANDSKKGAYRIAKYIGERARISILPKDKNIPTLCSDGKDKKIFQKHLNKAKTFIQIQLERFPKLSEAKQRVERKKMLKRLSRLSLDDLVSYRDLAKEHLNLNATELNRLVKDYQMKELQKEQGLMKEDDKPPIGKDSYRIDDGRIWYQKINRGKVEHVSLCNFTAKIIEEIEKDDGEEVEKLFSIEGKNCQGIPLEPVTITSSQLSSMNWVTSKWGTKAIIEAGQGNKDHIRCALQYLSENIQTKKIYVHTGWSEEKNKHIFITASGVLGTAKEIQVELEGPLERYMLPSNPQNIKKAVRQSLKFLRIAPYNVTAPLWAGVYLAPLKPFLSQDFVLWLYGSTGSMKSTLSALALSHFGDFDEETLPVEWRSTANAIEKIAFLAKDVPAVIDDFAPQRTSGKAKEFENKAEHIIRAVGNRSGRGRLGSDLQFRKTHIPRGFVISTGEQLPEGQSILARMLMVEIQIADIDKEKLTEAQINQAAYYPHAMAEYILWIADRWDQLQEKLPKKWIEERQNIQDIKASHLRLNETFASLSVAMDTALSFVQEKGKIPQKEIKKIRNNCKEALREVVDQYSKQIRQERPTSYFLDALQELVAQKKLYLVDKKSTVSEARRIGDKLGWKDKNYVYLSPSVAYNNVRSFAEEEGKYFSTKRTDLGKMLKQERILIPHGESPTIVINVQSGSQRVWRIKYETFYPGKKKSKGKGKRS